MSLALWVPNPQAHLGSEMKKNTFFYFSLLTEAVHFSHFDYKTFKVLRKQRLLLPHYYVGNKKIKKLLSSSFLMVEFSDPIFFCRGKSGATLLFFCYILI